MSSRSRFLVLGLATALALPLTLSPGSPLAPSLVTGQPGEPRLFAGGPLSETAILASLAAAHPDRFRPVGTSAVVFHVPLTGDIDMAFKAESRIHPHGWLAEVAAFRIAQELAFDNVPPAIIREIDRGRLRRRLEEGHIFEDVESDCIVHGSVIRGAAIYWVPDMQDSDLDRPEGIARFRAWLAIDGTIPEDARATARDISDMILFDYLIANRDRWSGGNVKLVDGGRVIVRDHNLAFPRRLDEMGHRRMLDHLTRVQRFSRMTIQRLSLMDDHSLRAALEHDVEALEGGELLLDAERIAGLVDRRETILSYVGALVEEYGEEAVLFFN